MTLEGPPAVDAGSELMKEVVEAELGPEIQGEVRVREAAAKLVLDAGGQLAQEGGIPEVEGPRPVVLCGVQPLHAQEQGELLAAAPGAGVQEAELDIAIGQRRLVLDRDHVQPAVSGDEAGCEPLGAPEIQEPE